MKHFRDTFFFKDSPDFPQRDSRMWTYGLTRKENTSAESKRRKRALESFRDALKRLGSRICNFEHTLLFLIMNIIKSKNLYRVALLAAASSSCIGHSFADAEKTANHNSTAPSTSSLSPVRVTIPRKEKDICTSTDKPSYTWNASTGEVVVDPLVYTRIDKEFLERKEFKGFGQGNALHDTLMRPNLIEKYEVYKKIDCDEILCVVRFGSLINGHPNYIHGGITSLVFDNTFGWLFLSLGLPLAVTANLNVNFRSPLPKDTTCVLTSQMKNLEGRKMYMEAVLRDVHGKVIADSSSLFVALRPMAQLAMKVSELSSGVQ